MENPAYYLTLSGCERRQAARRGQISGMKKYIREMIDDLKTDKSKNYIPPVPKGAASEKVTDLNPPTTPVVPQDLSNQELSEDPGERVKQLDYQAFESERLQTDS